MKIAKNRTIPLKSYVLGILVPLFIWIDASVFAQEYIYNARLLTTDDGLANLMTTALFQDQGGYLWIGTNTGLNRYDGYDFQLYTKNKNGLRSNENIRSIREDKNGNLWLFYGDLYSFHNDKPSVGIDIFDVRKEKAIPIEVYLGDEAPFIPSNMFAPKIIDPQNRFWVSTTDGELFLWEEEGFREICKRQGAVFKYITVDRNDHVWLGYGKHVICVSQAGQVLDSIRLPHKVSGLWASNEGDTIWLAVNKAKEVDDRGEFSLFYKTKGTTQLESFNLKRETRIEELKAVIGEYIHRDEEGYWYTNFSGDLSLYNNLGEWIGDFITRLDGVSNFECINNLECDGDIWWGSPMGLLKTNVKKNPFRLIHKRPGHFSDSRGITEDGQGNIYFLNTKAYKWDPKQRILESLTPNTKNTFTYSILYKDGTIWAGTYEDKDLGVQVDLDLKEETGFSGIRAGRPYVLLKSDDAERYLAGTDKGIEYVDFNLKRVLPFNLYKPDDPKDDLLKSSFVYHLYRNQSGIWAASDNGIFLLNEEKGVLRHFDSPDELPYNDKIRFIHEDGEGIFWLATSAGGLVRWKPSTDGKSPSSFLQFTTEEGLSTNSTYAVYEDDHGQLWIPSDKGVMSLDKKTFEVKTFLVENGLSHNEFNLASNYQTEDGTLYFGGLGGLMSFHPDVFAEEANNQTPLKVLGYYLLRQGEEEMQNRTNELENSNEIVIKPTDKLFELRFALMDFDETHHHRYTYQIEGYDERWQFIEHNYIRITHLPYGTYNLRIKGQNINKGWSANELNINVRVLKPFYLQWWFIALIIAAIVGAVLLAVRWRVNSLKENQKRLEQEVQKRTLTIQQQAEELKALDKAKTRFFSNITHEFRTPLTLIIGPLGQLLEKKESLPIRQQLFGVFKNARQLLLLINQMLDLSKLEGGRMQVEVAHGNIVHYTNELIHRFQPLAEEKAQKLYFHYESDNWKTHFDKNKWDKIIYNLVSNAIKFTPDKGVIKVGLNKMEKEENEFIQLTVKDTGIGMDKEALSRIFDRFYQVDASSTRAQGGTGIGLSLVKELVELQGGTISAKSETGAGTTFKIELPVVKVESPGQDIDVSEEAFQSPILEKSDQTPAQINAPISQMPLLEEENEKLTLLLIEDNDEMRAYIRECIDESKYRILETRDGQEGINEALTQVPDLIISDVMMPKKDGFEVVRTIRTNFITSHIPIILLTAKASLESRLTGFKRGADAYLTKPFSPQELALRIQKLIEIRQLLQQRYTTGQNLDSAEQFEKEDEFITELRTFIKDNIEDPNLHGEKIGKHFAISRMQLYRKLKALTNQALGEFIRSVRIEVALQLIKNGRLNFSQIAYDTGFSSPSHFSRTFKRVYGKSPSEVRHSG